MTMDNCCGCGGDRLKQVMGVAWWPGWLPFSFDGGITVNPIRFPVVGQAWSTSKWLTYTYDYSITYKPTGHVWTGHLVLGFNALYGDLTIGQYDTTETGQTPVQHTWARASGRYRDSAMFSASGIGPDDVPWPVQGHVLTLPISPWSVPVTALTATSATAVMDSAEYSVTASCGLDGEYPLNEAQAQASNNLAAEPLGTGEGQISALTVEEFSGYWANPSSYLQSYWFGFEPQALARQALGQRSTNCVHVIPNRAAGLVRVVGRLYGGNVNPWGVAWSVDLVAANGVPCMSATARSTPWFTLDNFGDWWDAPSRDIAIVSLASLFGFEAGLSCSNALSFYPDLSGYACIYDYATVRPWASSTGQFGTAVVGHKNLPSGLHSFAQDAATPYLPGGYTFGEVYISYPPFTRPDACP